MAVPVAEEEKRKQFTWLNNPLRINTHRRRKGKKRPPGKMPKTHHLRSERQRDNIKYICLTQFVYTRLDSTRLSRWMFNPFVSLFLLVVVPGHGGLRCSTTLFSAPTPSPPSKQPTNIRVSDGCILCCTYEERGTMRWMMCLGWAGKMCLDLCGGRWAKSTCYLFKKWKTKNIRANGRMKESCDGVKLERGRGGRSGGGR